MLYRSIEKEVCKLWRLVKKIFDGIDERLNKRIGWGIFDILFGGGCLMAAFLMVYRLFFGIEFTDEAFTISDTLAIIHGNIPYTYDSVIVAGQAFVPLFFYRLFELFVPSFAGIFLYSRLTYTFFRFLIIIYIYKVMSDIIDRRWKLLIAGILIVFSGGIPDWGYNETSAYVMLLNTFFIQRTLSKKDSFSSHILVLRLTFSGFLCAISVFTHQGYAVAVVIFALLILICSNKEQRIRNLLAYCIGGITDIVLVLIPIIIRSGVRKFIFGLESIMIGPPANYLKSTVLDRANVVISIGASWWILMVISNTVLFIVFVRYLRIEEKKLSNKDYWLLATSISILFCYAFSYYRGFDISSIAGVVCVGGFFLLIPTYKQATDMAWFFGIYNILFIILLTIFSSNGNRFYYCIPMLIPMLIELFKAKYRLYHEIGAIIAILLIVLLGRYNFKNIYRDDSFRNLTTQVEEGVYKGIFTTPDRANDVVELEKYLRENISLDEAVSFRDNAPVAYLMRNKNICDVRTWDIMQYSYDCNDPTLMYRYYKNKQQIPDVIAYVDYGRDELISIQKSENEFQFNKFVNDYYYLDKDDFCNNTFQVLIYRNNGLFDGDYDKLLDSIVK